MEKSDELKRVRAALEFCYESILVNRKAIEASRGVNDKLTLELEMKHKHIGWSISDLIGREIKIREALSWERL